MNATEQQQEDMHAKIDDAIEGEDLNEVINALAYALADSVAYATDYQFDEDNHARMAHMVQHAYTFICSQHSVTLN